MSISNTNDVGRLFYKTTQGKGVKNIQGSQNGLQTHTVIGINTSFNQGTCWKQREFFHEQVYGIMNNIVYQDNQSEIRMEKNRKNYCTENSRHINIRYIYFKD